LRITHTWGKSRSVSLVEGLLMIVHPYVRETYPLCARYYRGK
jgi:hypothetical protein